MRRSAMAPPKVAPEKKGRGRRGNHGFPYPEVAPKKGGGRRGNRRFHYQSLYRKFISKGLFSYINKHQSWPN